MSDNTGTHNSLLVTVLGVGSTLVVACALGFIEVEYGWALYSFMFVFIIPIGAGFAGFAAASGYYLGAKLTHQKPAGGVLLNMIGASLSTYFLVNYIPYYLMEIDGVFIREFVSFWEYLDVSITNTSLQFSIRGSNVGSPAELGTSWGYAYAALQVAGFAIGGLVSFGLLSDNPYCEVCSKYMKEKGNQARHTYKAGKLDNDIQVLVDFLTVGECSNAITYHASEMGEYEYDHKSHHLASTILVHECPSCGVNRLEFVVSKQKGTDWSDIDETRIVQTTNEKLTLT